MATVEVDVLNAPYRIIIEPGLLARAGEALRALTKSVRVGVVSDDTVAPLHLTALEASLRAGGFEPIVAVIPAGERHKTLATISSVYDRLLGAKIERTTPILALGGGVVGDLTGFAAASILRGVPFVQVPTTLLSMVDASVGGKTGIDHAVGKNLIGAFHQPIAVLIDPAVLKTLPPRELRSGLGECIKHEIIRDAEGFARLEQSIGKALALDVEYLTELVAHNVSIKARVVEADPFEKSERAHLNFGHTFGHAIETVSDYRYAHGECVALGMIAASRMAAKLGLIDDASVARITRLIAAADLPTGKMTLGAGEIMNTMWFDKKVRAGKIRFVLPDRIGHVVVRDDVPAEQVREALESLGGRRRMGREHWLRLAMTDGIGPILIARIVAAAGGAEAACEASVNLLRTIDGIGTAKANAIRESMRSAEVEKELDRCHLLGVRVTCRDVDEYPTLLAQIPDPPPVLYVRGRFEPRDLNAIAIVGSRKCSYYGREQSERFAALLAGAGFTVVSGGARGIDSAAHRGAMSHPSGRTIAVLGSGIDIPYPPENQPLFEQIAQGGRGAVVSEYPLGTPPLRDNFPRRNRIVSGLSRGVLVIEADERSGALITARQACDDHGRTVFAVPGRVDQPTSAGPHRLIRDGAVLTAGLDDIVNNLDPLPHAAVEASLLCGPGGPEPVDVKVSQATAGGDPIAGADLAKDQADGAIANLTERQHLILSHLGSDSLHVDQLIERTTLAPQDVLQELTLLSLKGMVRRVDGGQSYVRARRAGAARA